jgi:glycosyltransferase involved in cell wall biosynthesis
MKFELSIIIPTLNHSSHLNNLINNICQQLNYKKFQIIIINQSHRGVSRIRKNKVIYKYTSKKNLSRARNIGLDLAVGKFICFLDDDIFLTPNYFLKCLNKFKKKRKRITKK